MRRLFLVLFVGTVLLIVSFLLAVALGLAWAIASAITSTVEVCMVLMAVCLCLWDLSRKEGWK